MRRTRQFRMRTAHSAPMMKNGPNGMYVRRPIRRVASSTTMTTPDERQREDHAPERRGPAGHQPDPGQQLDVADPERPGTERDGRQVQDGRDGDRGHDGRDAARSPTSGLAPLNA